MIPMPFMGLTVAYVLPSGVIRPAVILEGPADRTLLKVFYGPQDSSDCLMADCVMASYSSPAHQPGTWHFIENDPPTHPNPFSLISMPEEPRPKVIFPPKPELPNVKWLRVGTSRNNHGDSQIGVVVNGNEVWFYMPTDVAKALFALSVYAGADTSEMTDEEVRRVA